MTRQYINLGDKWGIVVYHGADEGDEREIRNALRGAHCPPEEEDKAIEVLSHKNTGFTYTIPQAKMSLVAVSKATSKAEYLNTIAHEATHVVSAIARQYQFDESGEEPAYIIGDIVMQMVKWIGG